MRDGITVGTVKENQFIGEMSFLAWENSVKHNAYTPPNASALTSHSILQSVASMATAPSSGSEEKETPGGGLVCVEDGGKSSTILRGNSDVICDEDSVVYSWAYKDLHELIVLHPSIGVAVERRISADLNKKITASMNKSVPKTQYRKLLISVSKMGKVFIFTLFYN